MWKAHAQTHIHSRLLIIVIYINGCAPWANTGQRVPLPFRNRDFYAAHLARYKSHIHTLPSIHPSIHRVRWVGLRCRKMINMLELITVFAPIACGLFVGYARIRHVFGYGLCLCVWMRFSGIMMISARHGCGRNLFVGSLTNGTRLPQAKKKRTKAHNFWFQEASPNCEAGVFLID